MTGRWVLVLEAPSGDPRRVVGGLELCLRLALDAQAAGAEAVVCGPGAERARPALTDQRLRIPVRDETPAGARRIRVGASWLLHRGLMKAVAEHDAAADDPPSERKLPEEAVAFDPPFGFAPIDVTDDASARRAERALFRSLRKPQDGWTSRWLNRYVSLFFSRWLVKTPLTPNQVSLGILAVGIVGALIAARGDYFSLVIGAALFQAQSILDGCDGEMSRVTHRGSLTGEWLDTVGDDITNYGFFAGAAWGLFSTSGHVVYLVAGGVTVGSGVIASALEYRYLIRIGSGDLLKYPLSAGDDDDDGGWFSKIRPLFKRDTFVFLTFLASLAGLVGPMLVIFALGALGILISVLSAERRMARERTGASR